jgi:hypothetical protein
MHSYTTLAVLVLAVSTASPAFSAPVLENEQRASIDERASALPSGLGGDIGGLLKTIGTNAAFGALPGVLEHFLNSTRRELASDNDKRASALGGLFGDLLDDSGSIGKVLGNGLLGGVASGAGALAVGDLLNHTRRSLSLSDFSGLGKTIAGTLASLAAADGVKDLFGSNNTRRDPSPFSLGDIEETIETALSSLGGAESLLGRDDISPKVLADALRLLGRQLDELD